MSDLDPDSAVIIGKLEHGGWLPLTFDPPEQARAHFRKLSLVRRGDGYEPDPVESVADTELDGPGGRLGIRLYEPEDARATVVVWLHGGGWVVGDLDTADPICRQLADEVGCIVASVDYRLAPEHPHPAPLDDVMAALRWAHARWPDHTLVVGGDSAGGGLAAGAALRARDEGSPPLIAQLLAYPGLDPTMSEDSIQRNGEGYFLTAADMRWFYGHYLDEDDHDDPTVNLLAASDLTGLPPAIITTPEYDPLHDEGVTYGQRLEAAGVPVTHVDAAGLIHGYLAITDLSAASQTAATAYYRAFARHLDR